MGLPKQLSEIIPQLISESKSNSEISQIVNCSSATVSYYRNKMGICKTPRRINWVAAQLFYNDNHTRAECCDKFGMNGSTFDRAVRLGLLVTRSMSEARKLSSIVRPRKHTEKTKQRLREVMLARRADGYNWTLAHSKTNGISYPEQFMMNVITNEFQDKAYVFQYPMGRFAIDFTWPAKKLAIEIDGEQHYSQPEQQDRDRRKDELLTQNGWSLLRIRWKDMFKDTKHYIAEAIKFVDSDHSPHHSSVG